MNNQKCLEHLLEETADVMLVVTVLMQTGWFDAHKVDMIYDLKLKRWTNGMKV